ncbi:Sec-independent protein translocase TatB [Microbacterium lacticum]
MFFGYDMEKFLLLLVVAALLIGPERLPRYAEGLARFTQRAREWLAGARSRVKEEMGDDFDDVEWRKLDPRQYDPRRIIRDALLEDAPVPTVQAAAVGTAAAATATTPLAPVFDPDAAAAGVPFDNEAT